MEFNKLIPELYVIDLDKSLEFYEKMIGFKREYSRDSFVFLSFEGSQIMLQKLNSTWLTGKMEKPFGRGINFQIETKNLDSINKKLKKENYPLFEDIKINIYQINKKETSCKELLVQDPDGYLIRFSQNLSNKETER